MSYSDSVANNSIGAAEMGLYIEESGGGCEEKFSLGIYKSLISGHVISSLVFKSLPFTSL
jgi:hypothetical protein